MIAVLPRILKVYCTIRPFLSDDQYLVEISTKTGVEELIVDKASVEVIKDDLGSLQAYLGTIKTLSELMGEGYLSIILPVETKSGKSLVEMAAKQVVPDVGD